MAETDKLIYHIPKIENDLLYFWSSEKGEYETDGVNITRSADWPHWQDFLETHDSFRYESAAGASFTAVKEVRRGEKRFWYAHRRVTTQPGKYSLKRKYLAITQNLTAAKLSKAAADLS